MVSVCTGNRIPEFRVHISTVELTPSLTAGRTACDKQFGNAAVTPKAHNIGAYIVVTFADVFPGFFIDLQTLLKCHLISQL